MSGIVGSYFNTRGSGVVAKLGTDGQVFTSSGAGVSQDFEAAAGGGKINQVINAVKTDTATANTTDTWLDVSGLSATITPSAADSTILVLPSVIMTSAPQSHMRIVRDHPSADTIIDDGVGDSSGSRAQCLSGTFGSGHSTYNHQPNTTQIVLDAPATTDAIEYQIQWYLHGAGDMIINQTRTVADADTMASPRTISSLTLMEVLA